MEFFLVMITSMLAIALVLIPRTHGDVTPRASTACGVAILALTMLGWALPLPPALLACLCALGWVAAVQRDMTVWTGLERVLTGRADWLARGAKASTTPANEVLRLGPAAPRPAWLRR